MSKTLEKTRIGIAMTGSFCTFEKVFHALLLLKEQGAELFPIMSKHAHEIDNRFMTSKKAREKLEGICVRLCLCEITDVEPIGPKRLLDLLIVAPCTGNTLAKIANGIADTAVTMAVKSHLRNECPVLIGISTNDGLGISAINIGKLMVRKHIYFAPYYQDDPIGKPSSLIFDEQRLQKSAEMALRSQQIQPLIGKT